MKVCHRVCGDRHGDTATTVELFDEVVALRIPALEVVDDAYGRFVVDVNATGTSPWGRAPVVVIVVLSCSAGEPPEVCARPAWWKLKITEDVFRQSRVRLPGCVCSWSKTRCGRPPR
jgi:hypothetical protein